MIEERAMELVAALRSGKYKQTTQALKIGSSYCCLGVACEISGLDVWLQNGHEGDYSYLGVAGLLPAKVQRHFGFKNATGRKPNTRISLASMNDSGASFAEIADYIEANWRDL